MPNMEYLEPSFNQHFHSRHLDHSYATHQQHMHGYAPMPQQPSIMAMPNGIPKTNETKPRLGKEEVEVLEREFKKNPKPTTQTKRQFADSMSVDLARINNWFQNRRAKRKQEKKQEQYEANQARETSGYSSEPSSPDFLDPTYYVNNHFSSMATSAPFPSMNGPPPPIASYNPQYTDPTSASMESLHRTMAVAAASQQDFQGLYVNDEDSLNTFGGPLNLQDPTAMDRAQFPAAETQIDQFDTSFQYGNTFSSGMFNTSMQSNFASPETSHTPIPYNAYSTVDNNGSIAAMTFPSELLFHDGLPAAHDQSNSQSPENSNEATPSLGFDRPESTESSMSPPPPPATFKSPPPATNLAARRSKVTAKPAALGTDRMQKRPPAGPRTMSHADGFGPRRLSASPLPSPMRRIVSAGGNRSIVNGRIQKSGIESAQRSPMNFQGNEKMAAFMEQSLQGSRLPPSLTASSSLNSSLAPPTPMSPREREMILKRESEASTSPAESGMNFVFNAGSFTSMESDQNMASPPETPQAQIGTQSVSNGWHLGLEPERQWANYDVADEALFTPGLDSFPVDLHMPQPSYISSLSQPVTPAFGGFNQNYPYETTESPLKNNESPQYTLSNQQSEYNFPDAQYPMGSMNTSPMSRQKTFQFSNTTAADFSEK
jgi:hypothetical protein